MPLYGSTYVFIILIYCVCSVFFFSKFILCQIGVILLCIGCMLVLRNKYAHLFSVENLFFIRKTRHLRFH